MIKGKREFPEELFIEDLYEIHKKEEFKDEFRIGTRITEKNQILTVQCMTINTKLLIELRNRIDTILYDKDGTVQEEKED
jgi:hypothetical protein